MPAYPVFISRANRFQLTIEPQTPITNTAGIQAWTPGKRIEFQRGTWTATPEEAARLGFQSVDALVAKIRMAGTLNKEFWEQGNEPGAMHPPTQELLDRIAVAGMRGQKDKIREIIDTEQSTHQREEVLRTAELVLGELTDGREGRRAPGRRPAQQAA